jgi:hypothetical protein
LNTCVANEWPGRYTKLLLAVDFLTPSLSFKRIVVMTGRSSLSLSLSLSTPTLPAHLP